MNNKICTSIEQSEKLLSLGLDPSTADMMWGYFYNGENQCVPQIRPFLDMRGEIPKGYVPAWSLTVLLELMPDHIQTYKKYNYVRIDITFVHNGIVTGNKRVEDKTYIDAVFEMICWLIEHGHIKVNK